MLFLNTFSNFFKVARVKIVDKKGNQSLPKAFFKKTKHANSNNNIQYKAKIIQIFKVKINLKLNKLCNYNKQFQKPDYVNVTKVNLKRPVPVYTPDSDKRCGVILKNGTEYLLSGYF